MTSDEKWLGARPAAVLPGDYATMQGRIFQEQGNGLQRPWAR
jgi:hypothetical protein